MAVFFPPITAVQVGLLDTRFIVTESVDASITVCAELQAGFLGRNISLMVVNTDSNGTRRGFGIAISVSLIPRPSHVLHRHMHSHTHTRTHTYPSLKLSTVVPTSAYNILYSSAPCLNMVDLV